MASSSDEGEIIDNGVEDLKASSLPRASTTHQGSGVDRRGRPQSKRSPTDRDAPSRYGGPSSRRSPSPRGHKRPHDDRERDREPYGRNRDYDSSRGSRPARYDDRPRENHQRSQVSYEDLDQPPSRSSYYDQDPRDRARGRDDHGRDRDRLRDDRDRNSNNRDRYSDSKRPRHRSRSPNQSRRPDRNRLDRFVKGDTQGSYNYGSSNGRGNSADTGLRYDDDNRRRSPGRDSVSSRSPRTDPSSQAPKDDAKPASGEAGRGRRSSVTWWDDYKPQPEPDWEEPQPVDEEAEIERRRKRRAEILSKSSSATPMLLQAVGASEKVRAASPAASTQPPTPRESSNMEVDSPRTPMSGQSHHVSPQATRKFRKC